VLDASALLAVVFQEPGAARVEHEIRDSSFIGSVNLAEVVTTMLQRGSSEADVRAILGTIRIGIVAFDEELAYRTGLLRPATRAAGLSLGDRACLALAERLSLPAMTADRVWATLQLDTQFGIQVDVIR
jgi:PIN domain nuclease of toxin-antitoxin system